MLSPVQNNQPTAKAPAPVAPAVPTKAEENANMLDALSLRTDAVKTPYAGGVKLLAAVNDGIEGEDAYDMASAANDALKTIAPALNETILGAGINAVVLSSGAKELKQGHQALKESVETYREADKDERADAALGVAAAVTQLTVLYRAAVLAGMALGEFFIKASIKVPSASKQAASLLARCNEIAASPLGRAVGFVNKWLPIVNATWILLALRTAFQVHQDPNSSKTTRLLSALNIGGATAVLLAGIWASCPMFFLTVLGSLVLDLGLATSRIVDRRGKGAMDAKVAAAAADPVRGAQELKNWLWSLGRALMHRPAEKVEQAAEKLGKVTTGRPGIAKDQLLVRRGAAA